MKNNNLKGLIKANFTKQNPISEITILNKTELLFAMGGSEDSVSCPMLQSCGTLSDCNGKCGIKDITVGV